MKVAIHKPDFTGSFAEKWIEYCDKNNVDYFIVDCLDNEIIRILKDNQTTHLLWHFSQVWKDLLTARNVLFSAEMIGIKVFPNLFTCWHFDDKVSQKYILEAYNIELVKSFVFYDKEKAKSFFSDCVRYPIVSKLRRGSGSTSVKLLKSNREIFPLIERMFSCGINPQSSINHDLVKRAKTLRSLKGFQSGMKKIFDRITNQLKGIQLYPRELGYIYFQEFVKNCDSDIRIVVIGSRSYGIKRMVRKNDFRASGSGNIIYDKLQIDLNCVAKGFEIAEKLKTQSIAIDFVLDENKKPLVLEISYGFSPRAYDLCPGYWDKDLIFHEECNLLEYNIIDDLINTKS